jgi:hypothetical protein
MKKIDKAVEIVRGWSDEELKEFIIAHPYCPQQYGINKCHGCGEVCCSYGWNEEVEE